MGNQTRKLTTSNASLSLRSVSRLPPCLVFGLSLILEAGQFLSNGCMVLDLLSRDYAQQEQSAHRFTSAVPSQAIAGGTGRKAVVRFLRASLVALYYMINFPVFVWVVSPASVFKDESVSAKVAMTLGLLEDFS
jgi:hypothetical protein